MFLALHNLKGSQINTDPTSKLYSITKKAEICVCCKEKKQTLISMYDARENMFYWTKNPIPGLIF